MPIYKYLLITKAKKIVKTSFVYFFFTYVICLSPDVNFQFLFFPFWLLNLGVNLVEIVFIIAGIFWSANICHSNGKILLYSF